MGDNNTTGVNVTKHAHADRLTPGYAWRALPTIVLVIDTSLARVDGG